MAGTPLAARPSGTDTDRIELTMSRLTQHERKQGLSVIGLVLAQAIKLSQVAI